MTEESLCEDGRICPKCGKVMMLCKVTIQGNDETAHYERWVCDGCGHKEEY